MANTSCAKKAAKQNEKRRVANKSNMSRLRTERKKFAALIETNLDEAKNSLSFVQSLLAKAAKTGLIHWKKAARLTSRMAQKIKNQVI